MSKEASAQTCATTGYGFYPATCSVQYDSSGDVGYLGIGNSGVGVFGGDNNNGVGVVGQGGQIGVLGTLVGIGSYSQPSGTDGVYGDGSSVGDGVHGVTSGSTKSGVSGLNSSGSGGFGVHGHATGAAAAVGTFGDSDIGVGVEGKGNGANGWGVAGFGTGGGTQASGGSLGVYGETDCQSGGCTAGDFYVGVYGFDNANAGTHYAGYFSGDMKTTGCLKFNGGTSGTCLSDARLKQNITPLKGALDHLTQLRGVTYEWKDPAAHDNPTGTQTGFIAQEVEQVFPAWVSEDKEGYKRLTIPQSELAALEVEAFKATSAKSDAQQGQIRALERRIESLEHALAAGPRPTLSALNDGFGVFGLGLACAGGAVILRRKRSENGS